jgi:hypothetical protein
VGVYYKYMNEWELFSNTFAIEFFLFPPLHLWVPIISQPIVAHKLDEFPIVWLLLLFLFIENKMWLKNLPMTNTKFDTFFFHAFTIVCHTLSNPIFLCYQIVTTHATYIYLSSINLVLYVPNYLVCICYDTYLPTYLPTYLITYLITFSFSFFF